MKIVFSLLIVGINLLYAEASKSELELHGLFNKKLIEPLKLGDAKTQELLGKLSQLSKEMLSYEDKLKENLQEIKSELKKQKKMSEETLMKLNDERFHIMEQINEFEKKKLQEIKSFLSPVKFSYYFVLQEKLMSKFKKAIRIEALTEPTESH